MSVPKVQKSPWKRWRIISVCGSAQEPAVRIETLHIPLYANPAPVHAVAAGGNVP